MLWEKKINEEFSNCVVWCLYLSLFFRLFGLCCPKAILICPEVIYRNIGCLLYKNNVILFEICRCRKWSIINCFPSRLGLIHLIRRKVAVPGKKLLNLGVCSARISSPAKIFRSAIRSPKCLSLAIEDVHVRNLSSDWFLSCHAYLLWHGTKAYGFSFEGPPLLVA